MTAIDRLRGLVGEVAIKAPCRVATTANITLNGLQTIDGVAVASDDRVLVWNQTNPVANGIYVADTGDWTRDVDFNGTGDCVQGTIVLIAQGAQYGNTIFELTTALPVIGTSTLTFAVAGAAALALASNYMRSTVFPATTAALARTALSAAGLADNNVFTGTNTFPTQAAGDNSQKAATTGFVATALGAPALRGYLAGLTLSAAGSSATFGIAVGVAADSTTMGTMSLASAYTKTTSAWAVGTGNGALDTGTIANSTWYHVHLIKRADTGVVDVLASLSATTPTMPANYTLSRRIGAMKTDGSAQWVAFQQLGDTFLWAAEVNDVAGASQTTPATITLSAPTGVSVEALFNAATTSTGDNRWLLYSGLIANIASATGHTNGQGYTATTGNGGSGQYRAITDTSARVKFVASGTVNPFYIWTSGWIDRRGRDS